MTERRSLRRAEDRAVANIVRWIRLGTKLMAACTAAFATGIGLIVSVRAAWGELIQAFWRKP